MLTVISIAVPTPLRVVGDFGRLPSSLPSLQWPHLPLNLITLTTIASYALAMAAVGLLESMVTARVVDDLTESTSGR